MFENVVQRFGFLLVLALGSCFSPQFDDGKIACGPNNSCPPGLECFGTVCRSEDPGPGAIDAPTDIGDSIDAPPGMVTLTITPSGNGAGSVTATGIACGAGATDCSETVAAGTTITLTATPDSRSTDFGMWSGGSCSGSALTCAFTITANTTVTATFTLKKRTITVAPSGNGMGTVTSNVGAINCSVGGTGVCMASVDHGTVITLTATPAGVTSFLSWSGGTCTGTGTCLVAADANITINAAFADGNAVVVTKTGNGIGAVTSSPGGITCGGDCNEVYTAGAMVTLTAAADSESIFTGWGGGCSGMGSCVLTVTAAIAVSAQFTLKQYPLDVDFTGNGAGTVTSTSMGVNCTGDCTTLFDSGSVVTLSATPMMGSTFIGWSGFGCSGTGTCIVTMTQARLVSAQFTLMQFPLTVALTGNGNATVTGIGINCGLDCTETYNYNAMVTLTPNPASGTTFNGWSGACSGTGACVVTMTQALTVMADFSLNTYVLTVATNGGNGTGSVSSNPAGINCGTDCDETYNHGTMVTLTPTPGVGSTFTGWSGSCSGPGACVVPMTAVASVTATFTLRQYPLNVFTNGGNGTGSVVSMPSGINCGADCTEQYNHGVMVTLTPTASASSTFTGWSGACSGVGACVVTVDTSKNVTASFTLRTYTLTVARSGFGQITSNVGGINCSPTNSMCSAVFDHGTTVTLTATPLSGSTFSGFAGGGCGGSPCPVSMTADTTVNATFTCTGSSTFNFTGAVQVFTPLGCATSITITAHGAQGGNGGGLGARITGTFAPATLNVLVGSQGFPQAANANTNGGGGGGSYVYFGATSSSPYIIAGGGGGKSQIVAAGSTGGPGSATNAATDSTGGSGNSPGGAAPSFGGQGGADAPGGAGSPGTGGGGAGWTSFGGAGMVVAKGLGGQPAVSGGAGGGAGAGGNVGGYGGGGGSGGSVGASGGGGGYRGGGGGNNFDGSGWGCGGGGGSFNGGSSPTNTASSRSGNGLVTIAWQ